MELLETFESQRKKGELFKTKEGLFAVYGGYKNMYPTQVREHQCRIYKSRKLAEKRIKGFVLYNHNMNV